MTSGQDKPKSGRWAAAAVLWLAVCAAAVTIAVLGVLSVERLRSPVEIENSYVALVAAEAFFLVFLWPFFERRTAGGNFSEVLTGAGARLIGLLLLATPLVILATRLCETSTPTLVRSQAMIFLIGVAVASTVRLPGAGLWYMPAAFLLSAGVPFIGYLLREECGIPTAWAAVVSPLWASGAAAAGSPRFVSLIVFACLGAGALLALALSRHGAPEQS